LLAFAALMGLGALGQQPLAMAQTFLGGEFQVNSYTTGWQQIPAVARNAAGEFLVVWESDHLGEDGIIGQGFDASGAPIASEFRVAPARPGSTRPSVAADSDGNFVVVFGSDYGTVGQKYDPSGVAQGAPFDVGGRFGYGPDVAAAGDGSFVVVWEDYYPPPYGFFIKGQRFDSTGTPLTFEFVVNQEQYGSQLGPVVASTPGGEFVVVWEDFYNGGVRGRRFDASGNPLTGEFVIHPSVRSLGDIAMGSSGEFAVVWTANYSQNPIRGRRFNASGTPLGSSFLVSTSGRVVAAAADAEGNFVVAWDRDHAGEVYAREFDADATPRTRAFQVNAYTTSGQGIPAVASDEAGNFVVVWESRNQDGDRDGIFGQRFAGPSLHLSVDGTCPGPVTVSIVNAPPNSEVAVIAAANTNGFVKGGTLCNAVELEIGEPFQLPPGFVIVDGEGAGEASLELGANRCFVQALALASCETSNVVAVP
jgi:hypothetical protein